MLWRACHKVLFDKLYTAKMHALDTSNVSCRDVTWRVKWNFDLEVHASDLERQQSGCHNQSPVSFLTGVLLLWKLMLRNADCVVREKLPHGDFRRNRVSLQLARTLPLIVSKNSVCWCSAAETAGGGLISRNILELCAAAAAAADILLTLTPPPPILTDRRAAAAAADRMSASRRRRFRDMFTSCCTPAICC